MKVPGGTVGNSGNGNVGINVNNPTATLDLSTNSTTGGINITTATSAGVSMGGEDDPNPGAATSPYALRVLNNNTALQPTGISTTAYLNSIGRLYLGNFSNNYSATHHLNTQANGIGIFGQNQSKLALTYSNAYGNLLSWQTNSTNTATRNLAFAYGNSTPFFYLTPESKVAIGTTSTPGDYKLYIAGKAIAEEVVVKLQTNWPDYVFMPGYTMLSNNQLRQYIAQNGKLPYLPSAAEVAENGVALGETQTQLTRLVEELTLRLLEMEQRVQELESQLAEQ